ncbi:transposable element Tcb1 transposase [Dactylonectria macrodidyma]|uniref:Transposable element Tcb1 transposase n=1 Tax=Dactylonectria macrodidyma TaxID=307937 RepID=A0A9P9IE13_9HYPO|nr:transposable element Tcb1 transposase [Dactylonectria macrodidyma]
MTQDVYTNTILEGEVLNWIIEGRDFVLEEDGDSGHRPGRNKKARAWKEQHFFSCPQSPDLSPIENCWLVPKQYINRFPHWEVDTVKELLAEEGWKGLSQETINKWLNSIPKRLRHVIKLKGKMTGW